jgi:hypothetical protein
VIEHLELFRGKEIEIRGVWRGGYITGNCKAPKTGSYEWVAAIWLEFPENLASFPNEAVAWEMDRELWRNAESELQRLINLRREDPTVEATLGGRFDSPARLMASEGRPTNGYGHLNGFPARIVIRDIKDIRLSGGKPPAEVK